MFKTSGPFEIHQTIFFMQGGVRCHILKQSIAWFLSKGNNMLEWPSNNPDLNLIENVLKDIKSKNR